MRKKMTQLVPRGESDSVGRVDDLSSVLESVGHHMVKFRGRHSNFLVPHRPTKLPRTVKNPSQKSQNFENLGLSPCLHPSRFTSES